MKVSAFAFDYAPPVVVSPFFYMQIVAALLLGALVFDSFPGLMSLSGMVLIVFTGVVMVMRQRVTSERPPAARQ